MNLKNTPKGILLFSAIEAALGIITVLTVSFSLILSFNTKPLNILIFVYTTSLLSLSLGIGLLKYNRQAYELLIFLAGVVILSKILIFSEIIQLNGALETAIPHHFKNIISVIYHSVLLCYLKSKNVKSLFLK